MHSAKRITLIPHKEIQNGEGYSENNSETGKIESEVDTKKHKNQTKVFDRIHRFIKIILKLARNVGYDDDLRIKLKNGKYLEKSNIVDLLNHAMRVGKVLYGEDEFIELLSQSGVDPDLIINDNVRLKLTQYINKSNVPKRDFAPPRHNKVEERGQKRLHNEVGDSGDEIEYHVKRKRYSPPPDEDQEMGPAESSNKRKYVELDDDTIDDDQIDTDSWEIPKDND